jgi:hypothetical protein
VLAGVARQQVSPARTPKWMDAGAGTRLTVSGRGGPYGWVAELSMMSPELPRDPVPWQPVPPPEVA